MAPEKAKGNRRVDRQMMDKVIPMWLFASLAPQNILTDKRKDTQNICQIIH